MATFYFFRNKGVLRSAPKNRLLLGATQQHLTAFVRNQNTRSLQWGFEWYNTPEEKVQDNVIDWPADHQKFVIIARQHRKLAFESLMRKGVFREEHARWGANIYNLDSLLMKSS